MDATAFLAELWGRSPDGWIQVWSLQTKRSAYFRAPLGVRVDGEVDVFTGVALAGAQLRATERAKLGQIVGIPGLWLDIDLPSEEGCELASAYVEPTLLVGSGHGLHAWYLLDGGPWRFRTSAERDQAATMAAQFQALHRAAQPGLDATHDLTRVLRLPGTLNAKDPAAPRPVAVVKVDGPRYRREDLIELCAQAGDVQAAASTCHPRETEEKVTVDARRLQVAESPEWVELTLEEDPELHATFMHEVDRPHWTLSEWEMSLASQAVHLGLGDQQVAQLIVAHRQHHDPGNRKATRADYLQRTIARARAPRPAEQLGEMARAA